MSRLLSLGPRCWVGAFVVIALALALSTVVLAPTGARPARCDGDESGAQRRAGVVTVRGTGAARDQRVLVVGDSYAVGAGLPMRRTWPTRLTGRVEVDGFAGSGFSRGASPCGDRSFATRARAALAVRDRSGQRVDLVVVQGGLNDTDQRPAALEAGFARLMEVLRGRRVLVVGPALAPARPQRQVRRVDAALARLSAASGVAYLSMLDLRLTYRRDRLHPDGASQRRFGARVARRVAQLP